MLIPSSYDVDIRVTSSLSRRVNANSQLLEPGPAARGKLIKKGEC